MGAIGIVYITLDSQTRRGERSSERIANRGAGQHAAGDNAGISDLLALDLQGPVLKVRGDLGIGALGAGFAMADVHLAAYANAGFRVIAIASRRESRAREVADRWGIETVHGDWRQLIADERVELVDVALPPHVQPAVIAEAAGLPHIRGILAQKPLATSLEEARGAVEACEAAGIPLVVNQNMRFDQSMRALKTLLDRGYLGDPVIAQITMHACTYWQPHVRDYQRTAILNMSVHHLDIFRHLFGEPARIQVSARTDPGLDFEHVDGIAIYVLEYNNGFRAVGIDNCFSTLDQGVEWRLDGTRGIAKGRFGWTELPERSPSTLDFSPSSRPGWWFRPRWKQCWFPDAFEGPMRELMYAVENGEEPRCSGRDNLKTMALIEAAYGSLAERRAVGVEEYLASTRTEIGRRR
jgi:predicted dehydrogenase